MTVVGNPIALPGAPVDAALNADSPNPVRNSTLTGALGGKVDKVEGKGLSQNDYIDNDKAIVTDLSDIAVAANNGKVVCIVEGEIAAVNPGSIFSIWSGGSF